MNAFDVDLIHMMVASSTSYQYTSFSYSIAVTFTMNNMLGECYMTAGLVLWIIGMGDLRRKNQTDLI